jgi:hypothetical protein
MLALLATAFTVIATVVLVYVVTHVDEVWLLVGTGTTIMILVATSGLMVSSIGVLIAALRYAAERNSSRQTLEQRIADQQASMTMQRQDD